MKTNNLDKNDFKVIFGDNNLKYLYYKNKTKAPSQLIKLQQQKTVRCRL
jgi:hypothetical protein